MEVWSSEQPTTDTRLTGGLLISSGYSSIVLDFFYRFSSVSAKTLAQ